MHKSMMKSYPRFAVLSLLPIIALLASMVDAPPGYAQTAQGVNDLGGDPCAVRVLGTNASAVPKYVKANCAVMVDPATGAAAGAGTASSPTVVVGNIAHDGVDAGAPMKIGGRAQTALSAVSAAGDRTDAAFTRTGVQIIGQQYLATPPTYGDGNLEALLMDNRGSLRVAQQATGPSSVLPVSAATSAAASNLVLFSGAGALYSVNITTGGSAGYLMLFNATSAPADGAVTPAYCLPIAANTGIETQWRALPRRFGTGATAVFSTTGCFTKTASATAFIAGEYIQ